MTNSFNYHVGGVLPLDAPTYVVRQADQDLFNYLQLGMFCAVLSPRQMGKSSLQVQILAQLQQAGITCARINMAEICSPDLTLNEFYSSLTYTLAESLNILDILDGFDTWWFEDESLSPPNRFHRFLKEIVLIHPFMFAKRITIFVDQIESLLGLPNLANSFFNLLLDCYHNRTDQWEYKRLNFAILGTATQDEIIPDMADANIFLNSWQIIDLKGFNLAEVKPLEKGLINQTNEPEYLLKAILNWTNGQPFLTQKLCEYMVKFNEFIPSNKAEEFVNNLVWSQILENWLDHDQPKHFSLIRDRLVNYPLKNRQKLLKIYQKIWLVSDVKFHFATDKDLDIAAAVTTDITPEKKELMLLGLIREQDNKLRVSNRIYRHIFDQKFIQSILVDLQHNHSWQEGEVLVNLVDLTKQILNDQLGNLSNFSLGRFTPISQDKIIDNIQDSLATLFVADRVNLWWINDQKTELVSISKEKNKNTLSKLNIPISDGIISQSISTKQVVNVAVNLDKEPQFPLVKLYTRKYGYIIYNLLALPLLNSRQEVQAVIVLMNKLQSPNNRKKNLLNQLNYQGFGAADIQIFTKVTPLIKQLIKIYMFGQEIAQKIGLNANLMTQIQAWGNHNFSPEIPYQEMAKCAQKMAEADQCLLWLLDPESGDFWTKTPEGQELHCQYNSGVVGEVAKTLKPLVIFREHEEDYSKLSQELDSLMCLPILNPDGELLGVMQLSNKRNLSPLYLGKNQRKFTENVQAIIKIFNEQIGLNIQSANNQYFLNKIADLQSAKTIYDMLNLLSSAVGDRYSEASLYQTLYHTLNFMSKSLKKLLVADQLTIFLLNKNQELWSLTLEEEGGTPVEIRHSTGQGLIGEIISARYKKIIKQNHKVSESFTGLRQQFNHTRAGYNIHNMLVFPLVDKEGNLVALIEALNKLIVPENWRGNLLEKIDANGFTVADEEVLGQRADAILKILEGCQAFHQEIKMVQTQQSLITLRESIGVCSHLTWQPKEIIKKVVEAAKKITHADKCALWLYDKRRGDLWTDIPLTGELRCDLGVGFVGQVAKTHKSLFVPFNLSNHTGSNYAQKTSENLKNRNYSLMCMTISSYDGELLGVIQLQNKRRHQKNVSLNTPGTSSIETNTVHQNSGDLARKIAPSLISFNDQDRHYMEIFNNQIGVVLKTAQEQEEILAKIQTNLAEIEKYSLNYQQEN